MAIWYITPLLLATVVLADYYIDNANTSVIYSMSDWETFSVSTRSLSLYFTNSTGNYSINLDASHCYDANYALGVCRTSDNCSVEIPFTGSGITIYVFNAGLSGMTAEFSIEGASIPSSIDPPPAPTYQVSNVSLYDVQGLPSGNHAITMTLLDWDGVATSMKFDYAHVNETLVASPGNLNASSTSSISAFDIATPTPTQSSAASLAPSHKLNVEGIIGAALGGSVLLAILVIGILRLRRRNSVSRPVFTPDSMFRVHPFPSDFVSATPQSISMPVAHPGSVSSQRHETNASTSTPITIPPFTRSMILRDVLAVGTDVSAGPNQSAQSLGSVPSSVACQSLRKQRSQSVDVETHVRPSALGSHGADVGSSVPDHEHGSLSNLTAEQVEVVERLRQDNVPVETVARVIREFASSNLAAGDETTYGRLRGSSVISVTPPPSYQTRGG